MKVFCNLGAIMEAHGFSKADLQRELGMDNRAITKLLLDNEKNSWRLDRETFYRLALFAHAQGFEAFRIVPHPMWQTFHEAQEEITIFRGTRSSDAPIEEFLVRYLHQLNSRNIQSTTAHVDVEQAMREKNCLFIGSPKANPASEMALALLWGAKPFDPSPKNYAHLPFHFIGMTPEHDFSESALLKAGPWHGFELMLPGKSPKLLKLEWLPSDRYARHRGPLTDGAVITACYQPLGTQKHVTTIIISGYTGLSSMFAAGEAAYRALPDFNPENTPRDPWFTILRFSYDKRRDFPWSSEIARIVKQESLDWTGPFTRGRFSPRGEKD